jgi:hypothetical protein
MNYRTTLALLAVAAVLGVLALVAPKDRQEEIPSRNVFKDLKEDEVNRIEVKAGDRELVIEKRTDAAEPWWEIVKPVKARADKQLVTRIVSDVRYLSSRGFVPESELASRGLANYGLDKPAATAAFKAPGVTCALAFGGALPGKEDEIYARAEGLPGAVVIGKSLLEDLRKAPEDFLDRTLFTLESWKADKISLRIGGEDAELVKKDADWQIEKPEEIREKAEYTPVNTFLTGLRDLRWKDFVAEKPSPEDLEKYGLKTPVSRYAITSAEAKKTETLLVGGPVKEEKKAEPPKDDKKADEKKEEPALRVYARKGEDGPVVTVEAATLDKLPKRIDLLRTKKIWTATVDTLSRIEVKLGDAATVLERAKDGNDWAYVKPEGLKTDAGLVSEFVTALTGAEVEEFYERKMADPKTYGFDQPAAWLGLTVKTKATVTVGEGDKKEPKTEDKLESQVWLFGKKGDRVYVKREDRGQVVEIKPELIGKLQLGALLFRTKQLIDAKPEDVQALTVERLELGRQDYAKYACVRENNKWALKEPAGAAIDDPKVNAAVGSLHALRAIAWTAAAAPAKDAYGLGKPLIRLSLTWTETKDVRKEKPAEEKKPEEKKDAAPPAGEKKDEAKPEEKKVEMERVTKTFSRVLLIGAPTKAKDAHYARFEDDPAVFTLGRQTVESVDQDFTKKAE